VAAWESHDLVLKLLLDAQEDSKDNDGRMPLSWATSKGYEVIVKLLLEWQDVEADPKDNNGRSPFYALETGHAVA
jgi:ankyrin repeat protein